MTNYRHSSFVVRQARGWFKRKVKMSTELLITTFVLIGLTLLRLGVPLLFLWLLSKTLRYAQSTLP